MECDYCHKKLSSKSSLKQHQTKTKYCIKIREKTNQDENESLLIIEYTCEFCQKGFNNKSSMFRHQKKCKDSIVPKLMKENIELKEENIKLKEENIKLKELDKKTKLLKKNNEKLVNHMFNLQIIEKEYKELKEKYNEMFEKSILKPTTTNTNNRNINIAVWTRTPEEIEKIINEHMTVETIEGGNKAVARFAVDKILKNGETKLITVSDRTRMNVRYKLPTGEVIYDNGMNSLTEQIYPIMVNKTNKISSELADTDRVHDLMDISSVLCKGREEIVETNGKETFKRNVVKII